MFSTGVCNSLVSVQPMANPSPTGLLFYLDYVYGNKKKELCIKRIKILIEQNDWTNE
jgi:hypothetical protein